MSDIRDILFERNKTHGDYGEHARITQNIKAMMRNCDGFDQLRSTEKEALEMFAHKIGRILAGNPHFEDHWRDIAGYATLVANKCKEP